LEETHPCARRGLGRRHVLGFFLFFVAIGALPPEALHWDGIGFLEWAGRDPIQLDYGHTLYLPLLRAFHAGLEVLWYGTWEYSSKLLSSFGAAAFFVLLWRRLERGGLDVFLGFTLAALASTTPIFWRQAGIVEPTTWTLAALLLADRAAERYGGRRTAGSCVLFVVAFLVLLGFHLVSLCAAPWLARRARLWRDRPPRSHLLVPLAFALLLFGALAAADKLAELASFGAYWRGFLPRLEPRALGAHAAFLLRVLGLGMPGLFVAGVLGAGVALGTRGTSPARAKEVLLEAVLLALPYLLAYLALGKPVVGLLLPVGVGLALAAESGLCALPRGAFADRAAATLLSALVVFQVGHGMVSGLQRARTPDDLQEEAELLAGALPRDAVLLAGPVGHHVRWFTGAPVVVLPNELHAARPGPGGKVDAIALVQAVAARESQRHALVYLSSEAIDDLVLNWGADPSLLSVDPEGLIRVRHEPPLYLVPLVPGTGPPAVD